MSFSIQSEDDLDQQINEAGEKLIVIDFFADWCGPCKIISPKLEELAAYYSEKVLVLKVNVELNEEITSKFKITSLPTFVFLKDDEVLEVFVGANLDKLEKSVEKYITGLEVQECGGVDGAMLEQETTPPPPLPPAAEEQICGEQQQTYDEQQNYDGRSYDEQQNYDDVQQTYDEQQNYDDDDEQQQQQTYDEQQQQQPRAVSLSKSEAMLYEEQQQLQELHRHQHHHQQQPPPPPQPQMNDEDPLTFEEMKERTG